MDTLGPVIFAALYREVRNVLALYIGKSTFGTPKLVHYHFYCEKFHKNDIEFLLIIIPPELLSILTRN